MLLCNSRSTFMQLKGERVCHVGEDVWRGHISLSVDQPGEVVGQNLIGMKRMTGVAPDLLEPSCCVRRSKQARAAGDALRRPVRAVGLHDQQSEVSTA